MSAPTYHLWFKPSGAAYDVLTRVIREIAPELNGPVFEPHVSLIGNLRGSEPEIAKRSRELGQKLTPFNITLTKASSSDDHFRCLFMLVEEEPSILNAHTVASALFEKPKQPFLPHLSLAYGSAPDTQKKSIIARLSPDVRTTFEVTDVVLVRADSLEPKDWHEIGQFAMDRTGFPAGAR